MDRYYTDEPHGFQGLSMAEHDAIGDKGRAKQSHQDCVDNGRRGGVKGGSTGGKKRAAMQTPAERSAQSKRAGLIRWSRVNLRKNRLALIAERVKAKKG